MQHYKQEESDRKENGPTDIYVHMAGGQLTSLGNMPLRRRPRPFPGGLKANTGGSSGKNWEKSCSNILYLAIVAGWEKAREQAHHHTHIHLMAN